MTRGEQPASLAANADAWRDELLAAIVNGDRISHGLVRRRYAGDDVKAQLMVDASERCMYCESEVSATSYLHVEHIRPKAQAKYPELTFMWENLGLACPRCNMAKSDAYDEDTRPIDPYLEDPADHLVGVWALVKHKNGSARGLRTINLAQLNRAGLLKARTSRLDTIERLMTQLSREDDPDILAWVREELEALTSEDAEFSMVARAFRDSIA